MFTRRAVRSHILDTYHDGGNWRQSHHRKTLLVEEIYRFDDDTPGTPRPVPYPGGPSAPYRP
jgi:hypothetical protein